MKKIFTISLLSLFFCTPVFAQDIMVEFMEENYKETQAQFSDDPLIYHSIQVNSSVGPKLLILTGDDYTYRKWLRDYIALNKKFITRVPDDQVDRFVSSKAYEIDVTKLHPINPAKWGKSDMDTQNPPAVKSGNNILIVDPNEKRVNLIQTITKKMGYPVNIFKTGKKALRTFKLQPSKFSMVIVHHTIKGMPLDQFVNNVLKISHKIPVIVGTGYNDQEMKNRFAKKFAGADSVHIKPVILKDLQKTIEMLIQTNA